MEVVVSVHAGQTTTSEAKQALGVITCSKGNLITHEIPARSATSKGVVVTRYTRNPTTTLKQLHDHLLLALNAVGHHHAHSYKRTDCASVSNYNDPNLLAASSTQPVLVVLRGGHH
jgi:hypothetical protein